MITHLKNTWSLLRSSSMRERGETPIAVMIGLTVFAVLALSAGPALLGFTSQAAHNAVDRRVDKALTEALDSQRRVPFRDLELGGPELVTGLGGIRAAQWVTPDPDAPNTRKVITMAAAPHGSTQDCTTGEDPTLLDPACVVRSAVVAASATDWRPPMSSAVNLQRAAAGTPAGTTMTAGQNLFQLTLSGPTRVAVVARAGSDTTLDLTTSNITRARVTLAGAQEGSDWRFGNALVCVTPTWGTGAVQAKVQAPESVHLSDLLVLTTPAPGEC